jgi:GYF domain 2
MRPFLRKARAMTGQYFFAHGETKHGPYTADQMRDLATAGKIQRTDLVWQEGMKLRFQAALVEFLFEDSAAATETDDSVKSQGEPAAATEAPPEPTADRVFEKAVRPQEKDRPKRVVSIKGGVLCTQDGKHVQFRKKCTVCGYEEQGRTTLLIRAVTMKIPFFCRKCRKGRVTEMLGTS